MRTLAIYPQFSMRQHCQQSIPALESLFNIAYTIPTNSQRTHSMHIPQPQIRIRNVLELSPLAVFTFFRFLYNTDTFNDAIEKWAHEKIRVPLRLL